MSDHWYSKLGESKHEVPNVSKGGMRPTTIADAKKHGYVPSVTTILQVSAKPALDRWKQQQLLEALKGIPKKPDETIESWFYKILKEADQKRQSAAARGTEIHKKLENYFNNLEFDIEDKEYVKPAHAIMQMCLDSRQSFDHEVISERSFYNPTGFGGTVDLCHDQGLWIVDFKTKAQDIFKEDSLLYDNHYMQLAAYRKGLDMPKARCYNLFISTTKPGEVCLIEHTEEKLERGWKMFQALLTYWKLVNNYEV